MTSTKSNKPAAILMLAPLLCLSGALVITLTEWQWRGVIGAGLSLAGVILLLIGISSTARRQASVREEERRARRAGGDPVSSPER
ncbi:hypothetical protein [Micrococcus luteus]|uniref:hypothetical protein n=1 Tax=Micrococcus luteus TaxID=1270 RepID=UPI0020CCFCF6|nr:hypothetical protein [Micrococcus luteus]UTT45820.1 hypothetical protein NMQ02_00815 [Micrococcus luteus]